MELTKDEKTGKKGLKETIENVENDVIKKYSKGIMIYSVWNAYEKIRQLQEKNPEKARELAEKVSNTLAIMKK